jgi:hypothetical protein
MIILICLSASFFRSTKRGLPASRWLSKRFFDTQQETRLGMKRKKNFFSTLTLGFLSLAFAGTVIPSGCLRIQSGEAQSSSESETMPSTSHVHQSDIIPFQLPNGTRRLGPQSTPTITLPPTSTYAPLMAVLLQNANCRIGPSMDYWILASQRKSVRLPIIGQDPYHVL